MNKLDWKGVGQFVAVLVKVWTIIRYVVVREKVGLEILEWIIKDGEQPFRTGCYALVDEYKRSIDRIIDFDSTPSVPANLTIAPDNNQIAGRVKGKRNLNDIKIQFHLDVGQINSRWITGYDLKPRLDGCKVFGAQLADFYLANPEKIPEELKTVGRIYFWGTIYCDAHGNLYVRFLCWVGSRWVSNYDCLGDRWGGYSPAAVSADQR